MNQIKSVKHKNMLKDVAFSGFLSRLFELTIWRHFSTSVSSLTKANFVELQIWHVAYKAAVLSQSRYNTSLAATMVRWC
jgi:hypothetical protein